SARVIMVEGCYSDFCRFVNEHTDKNVYALVFDGDEGGLSVPSVKYGCNESEQAHLLFSCLRKMDEIGAETVYVRAPEPEGVGLAVYNRLIRAAGFEVIQV
ncbi:MAG: translation factor SUA5, partial [Oscillospiraceae bacterium]|nr:translation factor SUA5 [Oscillospiraceae bacterium]